MLERAKSEVAVFGYRPPEILSGVIGNFCVSGRDAFDRIDGLLAVLIGVSNDLSLSHFFVRIEAHSTV
jgi:hypothetical protein